MIITDECTQDLLQHSFGGRENATEQLMIPQIYLIVQCRQTVIFLKTHLTRTFLLLQSNKKDKPYC